MKSTRVAVSAFIKTLSSMSALFSPDFVLAGGWKTSSSAPFCNFIAKKLAHIGTGINNVMHLTHLIISPESSYPASSWFLVVLLGRHFAASD